MSGTSLKYVLDANVFMEASRRYYAFDLAKPFWSALTGYAQQGILCSIDKVHDEIKEGQDSLKEWAASDFSVHYLSTKQPKILSAYAGILQWAQTNPKFNQKAKDEFMEEKNADTWICAFSLANNITIVTHELLSPDAQKRIPIPNVCHAFKINYCDTFEMLRQLKFSF